MRQGMGMTITINIVLIFIAIVFAFLAATLSYYKAFKVNNLIVNSIEKFEGYNDLSKAEIENLLGTLGYTAVDKIECEQTKNNGQLHALNSSNNYQYCIYRHANEGNKYSYGVLTYIRVELPLVSLFKLPIYTKTDEIYDFNYNDD